MADRDNEGAIWPAKERKTDKHPHFTGQATIGGVEYWVSAWKKDKDAKEKAPSLKFKFNPKEHPENQPAAPLDELDDDLPF